MSSSAAGITVHPELLQALELSGAGTRDLGIEVEKRIALDRQGNVIGEVRLPQILTSWDRLQSMLRAQLPSERYHLGHALEEFDQKRSEVTVRFEGGRTERADLLVGADGFRSSVRAQVAPDVQPIYAGYLVWRGAPNEADLSRRTLAEIYPYFTFFLPERQQVIGYPIAGLGNDLRPGHRRYNFIWYRVVSREQLAEMCTDAEGRRHEFTIGPPYIRPEVIEAMRADAEREMPPQFADVLRNIKRPFFTPIHDFSTPKLVYGRVALVGDAASSSRPHMGFGMSKAGDDARVLGEALAACGEDIDAGLARYETIRQPIGERVMLHGRKLGTHLAVDLKTDADRAMWKLLQDHRAMMDWIAVPHFLDS